MRIWGATAIPASGSGRAAARRSTTRSRRGRAARLTVQVVIDYLPLAKARRPRALDQVLCRQLGAGLRLRLPHELRQLILLRLLPVRLQGPRRPRPRLRFLPRARGPRLHRITAQLPQLFTHEL